MTGREKLIEVLEGRPVTGLVPHFEMVFYLTMEAFGKVHPTHRSFHQWDQMSESEQQAQRKDIAETYVMTAERYGHSGIFLQYGESSSVDEIRRIVDLVRTRGDNQYMIFMHGDPTFSMPNGADMLEFSISMVEEPEALHKRAQQSLDAVLRLVDNLSKYPDAMDGFLLCADYCFNVNPFFSPAQFGEFVAPYLQKTIKAMRDAGYYTIKHTDGNILPIIDQMVEANPHGLHSLDPQAGIDIADIKRRYGDRLTLMGNVNCGLLQTGTDEEVAENVRYALRNGMPGYRYIFSTSNCVYTGMDLKRYEMMNKIWREEGMYK